MNTKQPLIGVTTIQKSNLDGWLEAFGRFETGEDISRSVALSNGIPILLPVFEEDEIIERYIEEIDGLIISGGYDVHPSFFDEDVLIGCGHFFPKTDNFNFKLLKKAYEKRMPIIAICRGMQVANIFFGGNIYQDIFVENKNVTIKHDSGEAAEMNVHKLYLQKENSLFSKLTGAQDSIQVNSIHHQAVKDLAPCFDNIAQSKDGLVEVIEFKEEYPFFLGMQFHPEIFATRGNQQMLNIFKAFVQACIEYKK